LRGILAGRVALALLGSGGAAHGATEKVLHAFQGGSDGAIPVAGLINVGGTLYGTTESGGANGFGTVFSITPQGVERILHSFKGNDGASPVAGLLNVGGTLYGTTLNGGASSNGTVFSVTPQGVETVLYSFAGGSDGAHPRAGLLNVGGILYGTTYEGGGSTFCSGGCGTVFSVTKQGVEMVLHSFEELIGDGAHPYAGLRNLGGTLYGTTREGGVHGTGTVFSVTPQGAETVLCSFGAPGSSDGANPVARLLNVSGTLYGTTDNGGTSGSGTVFSTTPQCGRTVVYSFTGGSDGANPVAGLLNVGGTLYGTTATGGSISSLGTVFKITP
jgi:uncharacterized repeat protein (TIGR03803 family)